jgi:RNA polymerase I-specific transcription initiation factor RRN7
LQVKDNIKPGKLLDAVQEMTISLSIGCQISFMPLNYVPMLVQHIMHLTLPIEIFLMVKCLADILQANFSFPDGTQKRIRSMDNPEVLLITLVVVSTKLLHPLDGVERPPVTDDDPRTRQVNWKEWQEARKQPPPALNDGLVKGAEHKVIANEALFMDEKKMDDFMEWFENMWIGDGDEPRSKPFCSIISRTSTRSNMLAN